VPAGWKLERFPEVIERWIAQESPSDSMRLWVVGWVMNRHTDPYVGMRRLPGFPNLWFGPIRGTEVNGTVVTCSYWVSELMRTVRANDICTINQPI
jgi:hypothetical protein